MTGPASRLLAHCRAALVVAGGLLAWCAAPSEAQSRRRARAAASSAVAAPRADSAPKLPGIRAGALVRPDTVTVGDPFTLTISLEVPSDATVSWPSITDTSAAVSMRAAPTVSRQVQGGIRSETAQYAMAAWDVGELAMGLPDISVRLASGVVAVPMRDARIIVRTVLPLDTALHVPKPARPLFPRSVPWWELWWPAAVAVAALTLLWWLWRRRRHRVLRKDVATRSAFESAMDDFERLRRLALADVGERGRAVALAVEILRTYLAARIVAASMSRTSDEVLGAVALDRRVPNGRLSALLAESDAIKFAQRTVTTVRSVELQTEAKSIVEVIERAEQARRQAEDDARKAAERTERDERAAEEDAARRRSRRPKAGAA